MISERQRHEATHTNTITVHCGDWPPAARRRSRCQPAPQPATRVSAAKPIPKAKPFRTPKHETRRAVSTLIGIFIQTRTFQFDPCTP